ncbi:chain-length determining protein [Pseudomonas sp. BN417]|uniref:Wzz/FepE/Etk N-terminal domain-containing protein n=1 Tax=Pseudomonas sp. BN417 TaxID=2567890 RepID=UPI0024550388|nr:Wzz/FepE/Etk N-terminal domain-containing protein [Pseudomonas sp. BN417]MDH4554962.1 chain-length determining protein [Pseudomonas sp. BN417]
MADLEFRGREADEVRLSDWMLALWGQKYIIASSVLLFLVGAIVALNFVQPKYESKVTLLPPRLSDVSLLNVGREQGGLPPFDVERVYLEFKNQLTSVYLRDRFFGEVYLKDTGAGVDKDSLRRLFDRELIVQAPDKNKPEKYEVVVQTTDAVRSAEIANKFVEMASARAVENIQQNVTAEISTQLQGLKQYVGVLRESAKDRRQDRVAKLREALAVAEAVGVEQPQQVTGRTAAVEDLKAYTDGSLMYMRGAEAIRSEIEALERRKSDDPFTSGLRDVQQRIQFLEGMPLNFEKISVVTVDQIANPADQPISPNKPKIIAFGTLLGLLLGCFISSFRWFWKLQVNRTPLGIRD